MKVSIFNSEFDSLAKEINSTELFDSDKLSKFREFNRAPDGEKPSGKMPGWSPATYLNKKRGKLVQECVALVYDLDGCDRSSLSKFVKTVQAIGLRVIIHSSYRFTRACLKLRLIIPLDAPIPGGSYAAAWCATLDVLCRRAGITREDLAVDETSSQPSRVFFLPACPPGADTFHVDFEGELLSIDPDTLPKPAAPAVAAQSENRWSVEQRQSLVALLGKHYAREGRRHQFRLALVAFLLSEGGSDSEIIECADAGREAFAPVAGNWRVKQQDLDRVRGLLKEQKNVRGFRYLSELASECGKALSDWARELRPMVSRDDNGQVKKTVSNLELIFSRDPVFKDAIGCDDRCGGLITWLRDMPRGLPSEGDVLDDAHRTYICTYLARRYGAEFSRELIEETLISVAKRNKFDRVTEYLDGLTWDGTKRLDDWLVNYGCAVEPAVARVYGWRWLVGAVERAYRPGSKFDQMLILAGGQGTGKSTALRLLCSKIPTRNECFTDCVNPAVERGKDLSEKTEGQWIIEVAELTGFRQADMAHLKSWLSTGVERYRPAYGRATLERPRRFVVAGSVNNEFDMGFLADDGDEMRRFWVVKTGRWDLPGLERDVDQLWAEAVARWRSLGGVKTSGNASQNFRGGVSAHSVLTESEQALHRSAVRGAVHASPDSELIAEWADKCTQDSQASQICKELGLPNNYASWCNIGRTLTRLGWVNLKTRGKKVWRKPDYESTPGYSMLA